MSYLNTPRLTFSGLFEADVNTVNNDVRHYDVATFERKFQRLQEPAPDGNGLLYNGWWNPKGSNTFRLLQCRVTGAVDAQGAQIAADVALDASLETQAGRTGAKIVDLDPQFQFASGIWGLSVQLKLGAEILLSAAFQQASFRDIYFGRVAGVDGSPGASARFTGFLDSLVWGERTAGSSLLSAWRTAADENEGRLSMSLLAYGYSKAAGTDEFTLGSIIGSIAPWRRGEPLTFAPGRRLAPNSGNPFASSTGFGYMNAAVSDEGTKLAVDFGNSFPMRLGLGGAIALRDVGPVQVVVLKAPDRETSEAGATCLTASYLEGDAVTPDQFEVVGTLSGYDIAWLERTAGVVDFVVSDSAKSLLNSRPLALLTSQTDAAPTIALRETVAGLWVRADDFVHRIDAPAERWARGKATLVATRFGEAAEGVELAVSLAPPDSTQGRAGPDEVQAPHAPIPTINVPADALRFEHIRLTTDARGEANLVYWARDPQNPRKYIDGQIFWVHYGLAAAGQSPMPMFEAVAIHVRDAFSPPDAPSWGVDIAPILVQFGNLYPIMSEGLFSFSDYTSVVANARLLYLAFTRDINDPEYMPATRDLSTGKRRMMINWLAGFLKDKPPTSAPLPTPPHGAEPPADLMMSITGAYHPTRPRRPAALAALQTLGSGSDGKSVAVGNNLRKEAMAKDG